MEAFMAWYGGNEYEMRQVLHERPRGSYAHTYWQLILCNCLIPQLLWIKWFRSNPIALWIISIIVNVGMWLERYVIVVISLHADFLPSSSAMYHGTFWDYATFFGSIGLFFTLLFLFIRVLPVISIAEMRELVHETQEHRESAGGSHGTS
jgi:molybdopterin-containing oxidoreductase family membrane subunit